jgi:hypothetical protein
MPLTQIKNINLNIYTTPPLKKGYNNQIPIISLKAKTGDKKYTKVLIDHNKGLSLLNNLIASANGCKTPQTPTKFGPTRTCALPNTLRSNKVTKATPINTITTIKK